MTILDPSHALALVASVLLACCAPAPSVEAAPKRARKMGSGAGIRVMTFNVNYAGMDLQRTSETILGSNADVVALQETTTTFEQYLRATLKKRYPWMAFRHGGGAGGMAFLSRSPLSDLGISRPSGQGWFFAWLVSTRIAKRRVYLLNVHLRPPLGESGRISSIVHKYFTTRKVRLAEMKGHLRYAGTRRPLVVLGDFNEQSNGRATGFLARQGFTNALDQFDGKTPTWRWRTSYGFTLKQRLDHIYYSKGIACSTARVLPYAASDHHPVIVDLVLN